LFYVKVIDIQYFLHKVKELNGLVTQFMI